MLGISICKSILWTSRARSIKMRVFKRRNYTSTKIINRIVTFFSLFRSSFSLVTLLFFFAFTKPNLLCYILKSSSERTMMRKNNTRNKREKRQYYDTLFFFALLKFRFLCDTHRLPFDFQSFSYNRSNILVDDDNDNNNKNVNLSAQQKKKTMYNFKRAKRADIQKRAVTTTTPKKESKRHRERERNRILAPQNHWYLPPVQMYIAVKFNRITPYYYSAKEEKLVFAINILVYVSIYWCSNNIELRNVLDVCRITFDKRFYVLWRQKRLTANYEWVNTMCAYRHFIRTRKLFGSDNNARAFLLYAKFKHNIFFCVPFHLSVIHIGHALQRIFFSIWILCTRLNHIAIYHITTPIEFFQF